MEVIQEMNDIANIIQITVKVDTKTTITEGKISAIFQLRPAVLKYIKDNRLYSILLQIIRKSIDESKAATEKFVKKFWPKDTGNLIDNMMMFLRRHRFYNLYDPHLIEVGSNIEYAKWVFSMSQRLGFVNWTNKNTHAIQDEIVEKTLGFYKYTFNIRLRENLRNAGLGWMIGKGRIPKSPEVITNKRKRKIKRYKLRKKPFQLG